MADLKASDAVAPDHRSVGMPSTSAPGGTDGSNSSEEYETAPQVEKGRQQSVNLNRNVTAR